MALLIFCHDVALDRFFLCLESANATKVLPPLYAY